MRAPQADIGHADADRLPAGSRSSPGGRNAYRGSANAARTRPVRSCKPLGCAKRHVTSCKPLGCAKRHVTSCKPLGWAKRHERGSDSWASGWGMSSARQIPKPPTAERVQTRAIPGVRQLPVSGHESGGPPPGDQPTTSRGTVQDYNGPRHGRRAAEYAKCSAITGPRERFPGTRVESRRVGGRVGQRWP